MKIQVTRLPHGVGLDLPAYATEHAAGMDLLAAIPDMESSVRALLPGAAELIPTGISIRLPVGFEAQIRPRSGLALKYSVTVLNTPGTIDADYRGEIGVILINHGQQPFLIERGMRIAQMVVAPCVRVELEVVEALPETVRGHGGFGSTGR